MKQLSLQNLNIKNKKMMTSNKKRVRIKIILMAKFNYSMSIIEMLFNKYRMMNMEIS